MKQRKKMLLGMTSIVLTASLLAAGCSDGGKSATQSPSANSTEKEKPIEITWANNFDAPKADNNFVQKFLEDKFNVKIKNVKFERASWREKLSAMLASGDIPDILPGDAIGTDMVQWVDQGIIASISVDDIKKNMPNYVKDFEAVAPNAWNVGNYKGKNWGVPKIWADGATGFAPAYNGKWLKAIGYNEPPKTLAELEDVLTKFTFNDPDGNGKKDTFGMSGRAKDAQAQLFNSVFASFGVAHYQYKKGPDGKLIYGAITEEARQGLKQLNKWFKAGIIDPEFVTTGNGEIQTKFISGKIGVFDTGMYHHLYEDGYFGKIAKDKGIDLVVGKPITGPNGAYAMANGALQDPMLFGIQLEKDAKKRTKILQIMEFMATTDEGYMTTQFGEKGVSYDTQGDIPVWKAPYTDGDKRLELGVGGFYNPFGGKVTSMQKYHLSKEKLDFRTKVTSGVKVLTDELGPAVLTSKPKYDATLKTLQDTYYVKAITGEVDTDKGFDDFKAQWLKSGGQEVMDEVNKVYTERNKK